MYIWYICKTSNTKLIVEKVKTSYIYTLVNIRKWNILNGDVLLTVTVCGEQLCFFEHLRIDKKKKKLNVWFSFVGYFH